jgi:hypothetical protein
VSFRAFQDIKDRLINDSHIKPSDCLSMKVPASIRNQASPICIEWQTNSIDQRRHVRREDREGDEA